MQSQHRPSACGWWRCRRERNVPNWRIVGIHETPLQRLCMALFPPTEKTQGPQRIDPGCHSCRPRHIIDPQQVEPGEQRAEDRLRQYFRYRRNPTTKFLWASTHPSRNRRQRCTHQQCGRQQAKYADYSSQQDSPRSGSSNGGVQSAYIRHSDENEDPNDGDPQLKNSIDVQRV